MVEYVSLNPDIPAHRALLEKAYAQVFTPAWPHYANADNETVKRFTEYLAATPGKTWQGRFIVALDNSGAEPRILGMNYAINMGGRPAGLQNGEHVLQHVYTAVAPDQVENRTNIEAGLIRATRESLTANRIVAEFAELSGSNTDGPGAAGLDAYKRATELAGGHRTIDQVKSILHQAFWWPQDTSKGLFDPKTGAAIFNVMAMVPKGTVLSREAAEAYAHLGYQYAIQGETDQTMLANSRKAFDAVITGIRENWGKTNTIPVDVLKQANAVAPETGVRLADASGDPHGIHPVSTVGTHITRS